MNGRRGKTRQKMEMAMGRSGTLPSMRRGQKYEKEQKENGSKQQSEGQGGGVLIVPYYETSAIGRKGDEKRKARDGHRHTRTVRLTGW